MARCDRQRAESEYGVSEVVACAKERRRYDSMTSRASQIKSPADTRDLRDLNRLGPEASLLEKKDAERDANVVWR